MRNSCWKYRVTQYYCITKRKEELHKYKTLEIIDNLRSLDYNKKKKKKLLKSIYTK